MGLYVRVARLTSVHQLATLSGVHLAHCQVHLNRVSHVGVCVCAFVFSMSSWCFFFYCLAVKENLLASSQVSFWSFTHVHMWEEGTRSPPEEGTSQLYCVSPIELH